MGGILQLRKKNASSGGLRIQVINQEVLLSVRQKNYGGKKGTPRIAIFENSSQRVALHKMPVKRREKRGEGF